MPIQTYVSFVHERFNAYKPLKNYYGNDFDKFFRHYFNHHGFNDYLHKVLKGRTLEHSDVLYVGKLYMTHDNRSSFNVPVVLTYLNKHFGVEFDTLEPIYTEDFWRKSLDRWDDKNES